MNQRLQRVGHRLLDEDVLVRGGGIHDVDPDHPGLRRAAQVTSAWSITGGTDSGIMAEVGQTVADLDGR